MTGAQMAAAGLLIVAWLDAGKVNEVFIPGRETVVMQNMLSEIMHLHIITSDM